jgi:hypothetical protein
MTNTSQWSVLKSTEENETEQRGMTLGQTASKYMYVEKD